MNPASWNDRRRRRALLIGALLAATATATPAAAQEPPAAVQGTVVPQATLPPATSDPDATATGTPTTAAAGDSTSILGTATPCTSQRVARAGSARCDVAYVEMKFEPGAGTVAVTVTAANHGSSSAAPTITVAAPWDESHSAVTGTLGPGASGSVKLGFTIPRRWPKGTQEFRATVDAGPDATPGDNVGTESYDVPAGPRGDGGRAPDLAARNAGHGVVSSTLRVRVRVMNQGAAAAWSVVVASWPFGTGASVRTGTIAAGRARTIELPLSIPARARGETSTVNARVVAVAGETDLGDNATSFDVAIPAPAPDLAVQNAGVLPQSAAASLVLRVMVRNVGARRAAPTKVTARPSWGGAAAVRTLAALDAAGRRTLHITIPVPAAEAGARASFKLAIGRVSGEVRFPNNRFTTAPVLLLAAPTITPPNEPGGPGPLVIALLAAGLLAAALGGWSWLRRRRAPPTHPTGHPAAAAGPERRITTGFASRESPDQLLGASAPLAAGVEYYFCVEIGPPVTAQDASESAPAVDVALFVVSGDGAVPSGRGVLRLVGQGDARVERQPTSGGPEIVHRLLFPVGLGEGMKLRCGLYHRNVLLWSQLVDARVATPRAAEVDFGIAPSLEPKHLRTLPSHELSVLLNSDGDGTHALTFAGPDGFTAALTLSPDELQEMLGELRGGLRRAAWGDDHEWEVGRRYLYDEGSSSERLRLDLLSMALRGARYYDFLTRKLYDADYDWRVVQTAMRTPGTIQIAAREAPSQLFPAALLYDHPLDDTQRDAGAFTLCPAFLDARTRPGGLASSPCFVGHCPSWGDKTVICPSGFWGLRHRLGTTLSLRGGRDVATEIAFAPRPRVLMSVSTDPEFSGRAAHEAAIRRLCEPDELDYAPTRDRTMELLKAGRAHLVYFYCHGGMQNQLPILHVGPLDGPVITSGFLREEGVEWIEPRPLVFINGCRTTAVEPRHALEFVGAWLKLSRAAGVVGTEITVFEPLASAFAEACLQRFLTGEPLGSAVLAARLELLEHGNPLGLAYVPFALAGLRLVETGA